jgi:toxin HigB-1
LLHDVSHHDTEALGLARNGNSQLQGQTRSGSFSGRAPERFSSGPCRGGERKLRAIEAAEALGDLGRVPGNRLEKLKGDRARQWSIRINDQWRVCFYWQVDGAHDVEVVDYH